METNTSTNTAKQVTVTSHHTDGVTSRRMMGQYRSSMGEDFEPARERGRALAANSMKQNPESKARMEATYGVEKCQRQYPEAYDLDQEPEIVLP